eukprot:m.293053 g.293053  ORF g.293053 m.293053 type:complete len:432 (-) comp12723_c0_seq1:2543-3838(-)
MPSKLTIATAASASSLQVLLQQILAQCPPGLTVALIADNLESLQLDRDLFAVDQSRINGVQLQNGCFCGQPGKAGLLSTLHDLGSSEEFDYIVVAGTCVGLTYDFVTEFREFTANGCALADCVALDTIASVLDVATVLEDLQLQTKLRDVLPGWDEEDDTTSVGEYTAEMIEYASVLVLTNTDALDERSLGNTTSLLSLLAPLARQCTPAAGLVRFGEVVGTKGIRSLPSVSRFPGWRQLVSKPDSTVSARGNASAYVFQARRPFHPRRLHNFLEKCRSNDSPLSSVIRSQGVVWLATRPADFLEWFQVGKDFQLDAGGLWCADRPPSEWDTEEETIAELQAHFSKDSTIQDRRQEIVFFGLGLDQLVIDESLASCLLSDTEFAAPHQWLELEDPFPLWDSVDQSEESRSMRGEVAEEELDDAVVAQALAL